MIRRALRPVALALLLMAVILVAREPLFYKRYLILLVTGAPHPPLWFYQPSERIGGVADPAPLPRATAEEAGIEPAALKLAAAYAAARNTHALLVLRRGHLVFEQYWMGTGFTTPESADSFNETLTALAIGIAIGERRIGSIDEPASKYITEWRDDPRRGITIRNLLQMSSGLQHADFAWNPWAASSRQFLGPDITSESLKLPLANRPGLDWADSEVDSQMLTLVLERATGERYAQWLSAKLWQRIGAGDAWLWLDRAGGSAHAGCCLIVHQGDWLRVAQLLLEDGVYQGTRVLPSGWVRAMLTPAQGNPNYGFQLWLGSPRLAERHSTRRRGEVNRSSEAYAADDLFFLEGFGRYRLWLVPSLGLAILRSGVDPKDPSDWDESRIPNLIIRGVRDRPTSPIGGRTELSKIVPGH